MKASLDALQERGCEWAPRFLRIEAGAEVLSWLPGEPLDCWRHERERLETLAAIVRQLHDSTTTLAAAGECLVHDDLQPRNVVVDGDFVGLIDWEQLRPGRRIEDVAQLCWSFVRPEPNDTIAAVAGRWQPVLDAYGLEDPTDLVDVALSKIRQCQIDILSGSEEGSARHQMLRDRGDHDDLATTHAWLARNRDALSAALS